MRKCCAWFLLLVSTTQWVGGHICFEVAYLLEHEAVMSEPEQSISTAIYEETGIEASVSIVPEGQHHRMGADYGNYFVFTHSDSTGSVSYTIDYAPRTVTWEQVAGPLTAEHQDDDAPKTSLLKLLFSEFLFQNDSYPTSTANDLAAVHFHLLPSIGRLAASPGTPPPDFI
jgi:hypothetical protein